ncbi:unnamed protein product [Miscanthus lutarioriparius]|uniref:Uncharacterized protein n=1 Tax=Miscanthus lutarioriparius TaxID=422564 RepID=A0A811MCI9_9POAL|nr:unnamed protein product [Miscanthus lutarioriparius]
MARSGAERRHPVRFLGTGVDSRPRPPPARGPGEMEWDLFLRQTYTIQAFLTDGNPAFLLRSQAENQKKYAEFDNRFKKSKVLQELLEKSKKNKEKNERMIQDKYCLRGAEWGVGDCSTEGMTDQERRTSFRSSRREPEQNSELSTSFSFSRRNTLITRGSRPAHRPLGDMITRVDEILLSQGFNARNQVIKPSYEDSTTFKANRNTDFSTTNGAKYLQTM